MEKVNVISGRDLYERLNENIKLLLKIIGPQIGALASNSVTVGRKKIGNDVFSSRSDLRGEVPLDLFFRDDGYTTIKEIRGNDVVMKPLLAGLLFASERVKATTRDNSTTTIIFSLCLLNRVFNSLLLSEVSPHLVAKKLRESSENLRKIIKKLEIGNDREFVVRNVAMTSSKGNRNITEAMVDYFNLYTPKLSDFSFDFDFTHTSDQEVSITVQKPDFQYSLPFKYINLLNLIDSSEGDIINFDNSTLVISDENFGEGRESREILSKIVWLKESLELKNSESIKEVFSEFMKNVSGKYLFLINRRFLDTYLKIINDTNILLKENELPLEILPIDMQSEEEERQELTGIGQRRLDTLLVLAGVCAKDLATYRHRRTTEVIINNRDVYIDRSKSKALLKIKNLYEGDKPPYRESIREKEYKNSYLYKLERQAEEYSNKGEIQSTQNLNIGKDIIDCIDFLTTGPQPIIKGRGMEIDNRKIHILMEDACGSIKKSLETGSFIGGLPRISLLGEEVLKEEGLCDIMIDALMDLSSFSFYMYNYDKMTPADYIDFVKNTEVSPKNRFIFIDPRNPEKEISIEDISRKLLNKDEYFPVASIESALVTVSHVMELVLPMTITSSIVDNFS